MYDKANLQNIAKELGRWYSFLWGGGLIVIAFCWVISWRLGGNAKDKLLTLILMLIVWYVIRQKIIFHRFFRYLSEELRLGNEMTKYIAQQYLFRLPTTKSGLVSILQEILFVKWSGIRGLYFILLLQRHQINYNSANDVADKLNKEFELKKLNVLSNPAYLLITGIFITFCGALFSYMFESTYLSPFVGSLIGGGITIFIYYASFKSLTNFKTDAEMTKEIRLFIYWYELIDDYYLSCQNRDK